MPTIWNASSVKIWEKYSGCRKTRGLQQAAVSPTQQIPYSVKQIFYSETERVVGDLNVDVDGSASFSFQMICLQLKRKTISHARAVFSAAPQKCGGGLCTTLCNCGASAGPLLCFVLLLLKKTLSYHKEDRPAA